MNLIEFRKVKQLKTLCKMETSIQFAATTPQQLHKEITKGRKTHFVNIKKQHEEKNPKHFSKNRKTSILKKIEKWILLLLSFLIKNPQYINTLIKICHHILNYDSH